jgi:hypothetical protein
MKKYLIIKNNESCRIDKNKYLIKIIKRLDDPKEK